MEPDYTSKDEVAQTKETSESESIQELTPNEEFGVISPDNVTLPEESDSVILPRQEKSTEAAPKETPDMNQVADQASSSTNNVAGMFTTTAGAVTVVVAITLLNLGASDAQIIKVKSFEDMIFYHVLVDEQTPIDAGSLQLRLTSTNDEFIVSLDFGETFGFVPGVSPESEYTVALVGRNVFGNTTFGEVSTITSPAPNAVLYFPVLQNSLDDDRLTYEMRSFMEDPLDLATNFVLKTGYYNPYTEETTWFEDIIWDSGITRYTITGVPNRNSQVISQLTATIMLEEPIDVVLDETRFYTPLYHEADAAVVTVTNLTARFLLLPDFYFLPQATYTVRLLDVDREVQVDTFTESSGAIFIDYDRLFTNTRYGVDVTISFVPPGQTNRVELVLLQEEFITPDRLNVVTSAVSNPSSAVVTVTANGNIANYTLLYYEIDGERTTLPLTKRTADTALVTLPFAYKDEAYTVVFGLTNEARDPEYIIGEEEIDRGNS
jgi:hypothetical protein